MLRLEGGKKAMFRNQKTGGYLAAKCIESNQDKKLHRTLIFGDTFSNATWYLASKLWREDRCRTESLPDAWFARQLISKPVDWRQHVRRDGLRDHHRGAPGDPYTTSAGRLDQLKITCSFVVIVAFDDMLQMLSRRILISAMRSESNL